MKTPKIDTNLASRISAELRAAVTEYRALDHRGTPVLTTEREAARERVERLREEARIAWEPEAE